MTYRRIMIASDVRGLAGSVCVKIYIINSSRVMQVMDKDNNRQRAASAVRE